MKRVPRLATPPALVSKYVASHTDDAHATGTGARDAWARFRDDEAYKALRAALIERQQGLCGYCEARVTDPNGRLRMPLDAQLEHVVPKTTSGVIDFRNIMLCCLGGTAPSATGGGGDALSCGQAKGEHPLPPDGDPRTFPTSPRLFDVDLGGKITANRARCASAGKDADRVEEAITLLRLNCERLRYRRASVVKDLVEWQIPFLQQHLGASHLPAQLQTEMRELVVAGRLLPDLHGHLRELWTTERCYVEELAPTWVARHAALLNDP